MKKISDKQKLINLNHDISILVFNKYNKLLKPTKQNYPYDSVFGWQYLNTAKILYKLIN